MLLILALVTACGQPAATQTTAPTAPPGGQGRPLRVWLTWPESPEQMQAFFDGYTQETGVSTEVNTAVPIDKMIAGMSGKDAPDLVVFGDIFGIGMFAKEGMIIPLDDLIAQNNVDLADMYATPLSQCNYGGKYYCLPWGTDDYALYWNKDMFEAAGLDPEKPPETMEQMLEYSDRLTKVDDQGNLTQVGFIPDFPWMHTDLFLAMFGSTYQNADATEVLLDTPEMIATMKWQQEFYTRYGADKVKRFLSSAGNYKGADSGFYTNKIAMLVDGEWQPGKDYIKKYRPDMNYGIAPMPYPEGHPERKGTVVLWGTTVVIPAAAPDPQASAKLMAWMMLPQPQADMMIQIPNLPSSHLAAQDPRFGQDEDLKLFIEMMNSPKAQNVYVSPVTYDILTEIAQIQESVFFNGEDPEPLLKDAQARVQAKLDGMK
jgi:multiple sugar transport system substrate-binding protein